LSSQTLTAPHRYFGQPETNWYRFATNGLDGLWPYESNMAFLRDSPGEPLFTYYGEVQLQDSYNAWLMFKPSVGIDPVWVPLKKIDWGWSADVVQTNGIWTNQVGNTSPGTINTPQVHDATDFPLWTNRITGHPPWERE
jgi:hypothetical protein